MDVYRSVIITGGGGMLAQDMKKVLSDRGSHPIMVRHCDCDITDESAVNRLFRDNLAADGRFKPATQLRAEFDGLRGDRPANALVSQCGSGVTACHNLLALEVAGLPGAALYPGSWSEWCARPGAPVATGAA